MSKCEEEIRQGKKILKEAEKIWGWATPAGQERVERRVNLLIYFGEIIKGKKILEIGCGTGVFTEKIAKSGAEIVAIDISEDLITKAKENIKYPNVSFLVGDVENMNFKDNNFDSVIGISVLHHLNLKPALKEIMRVLKENGKIVFTEPNMLNPQIMIERNFKPIGKLLGNTPSETAFFRWKLYNILKEMGFRKILIEPFDFLHPWTPSFLIKPVNKIGLFFEKLPILKEIAGSLIIIAEK